MASALLPWVHDLLEVGGGGFGGLGGWGVGGLGGWGVGGLVLKGKRSKLPISQMAAGTIKPSARKMRHCKDNYYMVVCHVTSSY